METAKHLTENQLLGFAAGLLEKSERGEIGVHLLGCADCRELLPLPTPQRFFASLMGEDVPEEKKTEKNSIIQKLFSAAYSAFIKPPVLVWSFSSLTVILGFSVFLWFAVFNGLKGEDEMARVVDSKVLELTSPETSEQILPPGNISDDEMPVFSNDSNLKAKDSKPSVSKTNLPKSELKLRRKNSEPKRNGLVKEKENISLIRGGSENCGEENLVEMEFAAKNDAITFRWKKVENVVKYHLYVSDEDEILIDEYETQEDTSYVLQKSLDPAKTYKWKVIITLENGQTASGTSQKFTVKDLLQKQRKFTGKKNSGVRCSVNK